MTDTEANAKFIVEPLDPSRHDRAAFSCGVEQVDNFFKRTANKLARADNLRVHVLTKPDGSIVGFHALNAHSMHYSDLPEKFKRHPARGITASDGDQAFTRPEHDVGDQPGAA